MVTIVCGRWHLGDNRLKVGGQASEGDGVVAVVKVDLLEEEDLESRGAREGEGYEVVDESTDEDEHEEGWNVVGHAMDERCQGQ